MSLVHYTLEGTNGAVATTALTGASQLNNPNSEGTITFSSEAKSSGSTGLRIVAGNSSDITTRWNATGTTTKKMSFAFNFRFNKFPTAQGMIATLRHASGVVWRLSTTPVGKLMIDGSVVSGDTAVGVTVELGKMFRVESYVDVNTGVSHTKIFEKNSRTPLAPESIITGMNLGTANIVAADIFGIKTSSIDIDDVRLDSDSEIYLGPPLSSKAASNSVSVWDLTENTGNFSSVGTTDPVTALSDTSDTTYLQSIDSPSSNTFVVALEPLSLGPVTVKLRHSASTASPAVSRTIKLVQGTTVIATKTLTLPTTPTDYEFTTNTSETSAIQSPRNNLYVEVTDTIQ